MNRLQFFKMVGGLAAALLVKPKPVVSADDVVIAPVMGFRWNDPPVVVFGSGKDFPDDLRCENLVKRFERIELIDFSVVPAVFHL